MHPQVLDWAMRLSALAQNGLVFAVNPYDVERYHAIQRIAYEMLAAAAQMRVEQVAALLHYEPGYVTPKIDVRGVVFRNDALLFVRERADQGRWTLPGGWADVGDTPSQSVEREVWEESGYRTRAVKVLAIYDRRKHGHEPPSPFHIYKIFFRCELIGGEATDSFETSEVAFFREDEIPADLSLGRVTPAQVARMFEHYRHPELPTDFD
ncbi:MAG: NUDIX hydrolase [Anaerolineae bacterium]|nr:NUDIX hydrolase [Anaerolineae bacterium]MDW8072081.1 NUDIX hydrolase [Anaerolineae bacterium]